MKSSALVWTLMLGAALALPASALALTFPATRVCTVDEVATFQNRVHVRCQGQETWPRYYAVPTSSSSEAARLVTLGTAALMSAGDLRLWVLFEAYEHYDSFGCSNSDCRRPIEIRLNDD